VKRRRIEHCARFVPTHFKTGPLRSYCFSFRSTPVRGRTLPQPFGHRKPLTHLRESRCCFTLLVRSFAEIGAGRQVARWFLVFGGASGIVAKSISAYEKEVSDVSAVPALATFPGNASKP
jgi:hypothetical protein